MNGWGARVGVTAGALVVTVVIFGPSRARADASTDPNACGNPLGGPLVKCKPREKCIDGGCVDFVHDPMNCGGIGNTCTSQQTCVNSQCVQRTCKPNETMCDATCIDLHTSTLACGTCAHSCLTGQACVDGKCAVPRCRAGLRACDGKCVSLRRDNANCGQCGHECAAPLTCVRGRCVR